MKLFVALVLFVFALSNTYSQKLYFSLDTSINTTIPYQLGVEMKTALEKPPFPSTPNITMGVEMPGVYLNFDYDTFALDASRFEELHLENDVKKKEFLSTIHNTIIYVILNDQFVRRNMIHIPEGNVRQLIEEGQIGYAEDVLADITYDGKSHYWKGNKMTAILTTPADGN